MSQPLSFQQVVMRLEQYWAERGCLIWQPYSEKVGAGTNNPGTTLRVLGPEPWNVAYVEPSYRPDDGRYAENPNRMQMHTQYQVILKPDPGNPQELYLGSLEAIGIDMREHDVRFVEDKWESPVLGSWGLGWEVWLDGQEISQYTYFQQAGGLTLDPVAVELTYGLERIVMYLQKVRSVWEINWDGVHTYGEIYMRPEVEHCVYNFELADVERVTRMYDLSEAEARAAIARGLVIPAYDHILRCSHFFNVLDARGAIGVTERAAYFARMRDLSRQVARLYVAQREEMGYPFLKEAGNGERQAGEAPTIERAAPTSSTAREPATLLLEIGSEELPVGDLALALAQLGRDVPEMLDEARLDYESVRVVGTPRRQTVLVHGLAARQPDRTTEVLGPPAKVAFDADGKPTRAAEGFARKQGIAVADLRVVTEDDKSYAVATVTEQGRPAAEVLAEAFPDLVSGLRFPRSIRWNQTNVAFSRPIRWFVALLGNSAIPFEYAGVQSGRTTRGIRPYGSPAIRIESADGYLPAMAAHHVVVDLDERRELVRTQVAALAESVGGRIPDDPALLEEVTNLIEYPTAVLGQFEQEYLTLPSDVLVTVMKKHQRFFPVRDRGGELMPYFVAVRNGDDKHLDVVRQGYEDVIRARFADAKFFYEHDIRQPLEAFLPRLDTLTFQQDLGSMLDKSHRLERLAPVIAHALDLDAEAVTFTQRAAQLAKADLATQLVVEFTSLQGLMGSHYSTLSGEDRAVSAAIFEHYLPRFAGDQLPENGPGLALGLADRLDSLVGLFAAGLAPTGSADPYQLRRAALGIVETLIERKAVLDLRPLMADAATLIPIDVSGQVLDDVAEFIAERLRGWLREHGLRYDVVDAVLAERGDNPYAAYRAARQLTAWVERDDWDGLLNAYGRCIRIVRDRENRDEFQPGVDEDTATVALREAYETAHTQVQPDSDVDRLLTAIHPMIPAINRFFDDVLVMHEDEALRSTRLGLLFDIWDLSDGIADLTRLEGF